MNLRWRSSRSKTGFQVSEFQGLRNSSTFDAQPLKGRSSFEGLEVSLERYPDTSPASLTRFVDTQPGRTDSRGWLSLRERILRLKFCTMGDSMKRAAVILGALSLGIMSPGTLSVAVWAEARNSAQATHQNPPAAGQAAPAQGATAAPAQAATPTPTPAPARHPPP